MVYVADRGNNRVQKFTPEGKLLAVIDSKGKGGGRLKGPYGLCVDDNGILYVTECGSNTVSMFTSKGRFLDISVTVMALVSTTLSSSYPTRQVDCTSVTTMEWSPTNNSDWNILCVIVFTQLLLIPVTVTLWTLESNNLN